MKKIDIRKIIPYILIFIFFLSWNLFIARLNLDEVWNYGFSNNIYNGLIPYKDFNMVITPLFPFLGSIPFFIFGSDLLTFHIFGSLVLTITIYLISKLVKDKTNLFILLFLIPVSLTYPSYNTFLLTLFIMLILSEKNKKSDYLIGFILSMLILTKHTVGFMLFLPSLLYLKNDYKKVLKRLSIISISMIVFLLYLIITNSLSQFINLCVLGLIDFSSNSKGINIIFILSLILIIINIINIIKDKKDINNYYLLMFSSILIPIFDLYHFEIYLIAFLIILFMNKDINLKININLFAIGVIIGISVILLSERLDNIIYPNKINNFSYKLMDKKYIDYTNKINKKIKEYGIDNIIFLGEDGYYFKIINDRKTTYLDLINQGNWGYNGENKHLKEIKKNKDKIFFVNKNELKSNKQSMKKAIKYVIENGKRINKIYKYDIYKLK